MRLFLEPDGPRGPCFLEAGLWERAIAQLEEMAHEQLGPVQASIYVCMYIYIYEYNAAIYTSYLDSRYIYVDR